MTDGTPLHGTPLHGTPLHGVDVVLADLDGVVYKGPVAIPFAIESINRAATTSRVGYVTNNASRTPASVAEQLRGLGLNVGDDEVVTSPQAAVRLLTSLVSAGSLVLAVGGEGLRTELALAGFAVTDSADDGPVAVVQGYAPEVGWKHLAEAAFALQGEGAERVWVATNQDWTLPTARGIAPGNGTLVSAVHTAIGRLPIVAGKPEVAIFEEAIARFGATKPLFPVIASTPTSSVRTARVSILCSCSRASMGRNRCSPPTPVRGRPTFLITWANCTSRTQRSRSRRMPRATRSTPRAPRRCGFRFRATVLVESALSGMAMPRSIYCARVARPCGVRGGPSTHSRLMRRYISHKLI